MQQSILGGQITRRAIVASTVFMLAVCGLATPPSQAQVKPKPQPAIPAPDDRYKADILVVVAHPDDDTGISTYLAKAVLDQGKRVAVIYGTKGNSGGNAIGMEQGKALADERDMEARHALSTLGITNVWFLRGSDTPTQDVLHSLETLGHGEALEEVVRLVRLTRPQVIITWLPAYVAGENHGDHQAAGVVATEAFDMAADPAAFPEQINAPRAYTGIGNYGEGLHPWQVKKLYYFSDATHQEFLEHHGPAYLATDMSRAKGVPIVKLNKGLWDAYATQGDDNVDYYTKMPEYLVLAKSMVTSPRDADVWDGIGSEPATPASEIASTGAQRPPVSLELGGPWAFYKQFYKAHKLSSIDGLVKPQTALGGERSLWVPLLLHNDTAQAHDVSVHSILPSGWTGIVEESSYHLEPHSTYPAQLFLTSPPAAKNAPTQQLRWVLGEDGKDLGDVSLEVSMEYNGVPQ